MIWGVNINFVFEEVSNIIFSFFFLNKQMTREYEEVAIVLGSMQDPAPNAAGFWLQGQDDIA